MNISLIICTCNRYEKIINTIQSILANSLLPDEFIIVDQSDDFNKMQLIVSEFINNFPIKLIHDTNKGLSRARNIGIHESKGEIIIFTDDDTFVDNNWIKNISNTFKLKQYNTGIVGGKIIPVYLEKNEKWTIPKRWEHFLPSIAPDQEKGIYKNGLPAGANISFKREVFSIVGDFDENLGVNAAKKFQLYGEDSDIVIRAMKKDFDIIYNPECIVYHPVPLARQNQNYLNRRCYIEGATKQFLDFKNNSYSRLKKIRMIAAAIVKFLKFSTITNRMDKATYKGHQYFLLGRIFILRKNIF